MPEFLLDTHIVLWWLAAPKKLSRDQTRVLNEAVRRNQSVGVSAITLLEIAILARKGVRPTRIPIDEVFRHLEGDPVFEILPFTIDIAAEWAVLGGSLPDPADRAIVSTARVRRLRLLTADQRIIDSGLVPVVV
jgi:PIN domain nuclease of toxin-antitoxin system